jgi:phosphoribosylpyrophosphate synthetase
LPRVAGLEAIVRADSITHIVGTDSTGISPDLTGAAVLSVAKLTILSVAPLLGQAVRRLVAGKPLAPLFSRWPVVFEA